MDTSTGVGKLATVKGAGTLASKRAYSWPWAYYHRTTGILGMLFGISGLSVFIIVIMIIMIKPHSHAHIWRGWSNRVSVPRGECVPASPASALLSLTPGPLMSTPLINTGQPTLYKHMIYGIILITLS